MTRRKRCLCTFSFYDQQSVQKKLEEMAEQGWMIEKVGTLLWTYQRIEPRKLCFAVTYFPDASEFDPGPTEGELTKLDFCAQDGWTLAARWGAMQIFYNENENAVPIETDPVTQVENIHRTMKKPLIRSHIFTTALILYYLILQLCNLFDKPAEYLSDPFYLYSLTLYLGLLAACLFELFSYLHWHKKARKAAENDGVFLPAKSRHSASCLLIAFSALCLLLAYSGSSSTSRSIWFIIIWGSILFLIFAAGQMIKNKLKKKGFPRGLNQVISAGSVMLMTVAGIGILVIAVINGSFPVSTDKKPVGTYELYGTVREIYDDPLPLEIEDLRNDNIRWSKELSHQETFLLSYRECEQRDLPRKNKRISLTLDYTIIDVKLTFLYDFIKNAKLNEKQDEVHDGFVFTDHYEPIDAAPWNANEVYQHHWSDSVLNSYLVCWDNRIVEIGFYWEPTTEELAAAAEILRTA